MNPKIICLLAALSLAVSGSGLAAGAKTYQITGTVVEATGSKVTVEKGTNDSNSISNQPRRKDRPSSKSDRP